MACLCPSLDHYEHGEQALVPAALDVRRHQSCPPRIDSSFVLPVGLPPKRHKTSPASILTQQGHQAKNTLFAYTNDGGPCTTTPLQQTTLTFWACLCSTVLAAAQYQSTQAADCCSSSHLPFNNDTLPTDDASSTTFLRSACEIRGLHEVILLHGLQVHASAILNWCQDNGACCLEEVADNVEDLCKDAALGELDCNRLETWAAKFKATPDLIPPALKFATVPQFVDEEQDDVVGVRRTCIRWAYPMVSVLEFCADEDEHDEDGSYHESEDGSVCPQMKRHMVQVVIERKPKKKRW